MTYEHVGCPECGAPAEVVNRFVLASTDGPLEHLRLWCVTGRWFTVLAQDLPAAAAPVGERPARWTSPRP